jgi:hypothetical protein
MHLRNTYRPERDRARAGHLLVPAMCGAPIGARDVGGTQMETASVLTMYPEGGTSRLSVAVRPRP